MISFLFVFSPGENLVPEPPDEDEEDDRKGTDWTGADWARKTGSRSKVLHEDRIHYVICTDQTMNLELYTDH